MAVYADAKNQYLRTEKRSQSNSGKAAEHWALWR